jgi:Skp family chaperone for outer membrane proteins
MVRNVVIAALAVATAALGYQYQQATKAADQQSQLIVETREKAEKELQALRDKFASEERDRQKWEQDAKTVSSKLAEEQAARDAAEQSAKAANERLTQVQNALTKAQQEKDQAVDALAKERAKSAGQQKPAG